MINLIDKCLKRIDQGELVGSIFFDLKKAFDVVDHELLLKKKKEAFHIRKNEDLQTRIKEKGLSVYLEVRKEKTDDWVKRKV